MKKKTLIIITAALVVVLLLAFFGDDLVRLIKDGPAGPQVPALTNKLSKNDATDDLKGLTIEELQAAWGNPSDELAGEKAYVWGIPNDNEFLVVYYDTQKVITEVKYVFVMRATVTEVTGNTMLVCPVDGEPELKSSDSFSVSLDVASEQVKARLSAGDTVYISYSGAIMETYPAQFSTVMRIDIIQSAD